MTMPGKTVLLCAVGLLGVLGCGKTGPQGKAPSIEQFSVEPNAIKPDQQATLQWHVKGPGPIELEIDQGIGAIEDDMAPVVSPDETTTYTLTATNDFGSTSGTATLMVTERDKSVMLSEIKDVHTVQNTEENGEGDVTFSVHTMPPEAVGRVEVAARSDNDDVVDSAGLDPGCDPEGECSMTFPIVRQSTAEAKITVEVKGPGTTRDRTSFHVNVVPLRVVRTGDSGSGSLRNVANVAAPGTAIRFDIKDGASTIELERPIVVDKALTIRGPGRDQLSISGKEVTRLFDVAAAGKLDLSGVTLERGSVAAEERGGCVRNMGTLQLAEVDVQDCAAGQGGGALYNGGEATLGMTALLRNGARYGAAVYNEGTLTVRNTMFRQNAAGVSGAALYNEGRLMLRASTLTGNNAAVYGGGMFNDDPDAVEGEEEPPAAYVTNTTFDGNEADEGGAMYNRGTLQLAFVTVAGNTADTEGGGLYGVAPVSSRASILADNTAPAGPDLTGTLQTLGYNLIADPAGAVIEGEAPGDLLEVEAGLGPLQDNGGYTRTRQPGADSPAVDHVVAEACLDGLDMSLMTDQRGENRPVPSDGNCDVGSVELQ